MLQGFTLHCFSGAQVKSLPRLKHLKLRGYMLTELNQLPATLEILDLGECRVTYEQEVSLPQHLTLKHLALPQWAADLPGPRHSQFRVCSAAACCY